MPALEEKRGHRRGLTFKLSEAGIDLPKEFAQKPPKRRHKKSRGKERPRNHRTNKERTMAEQQTAAVNIPPAGGDASATVFAREVAEAFKPAVTSLEEAAGRVMSKSRKFDLQERGLNIAEFSLKGGIVLGLASAGGLIARRLWRNRHAPVEES